MQIPENSLLNLISTTKEKLSEVYKTYKAKQIEHLKLPTDEEGWLIGDTLFLLNNLIVQESLQVEYSSIVSITFFASQNKVGFVSDNNVMFLSTSVNDIEKQEYLMLTLLQRESKQFKVDNKTFDIVQSLYKHIANVTFENRLKYYIDYLLLNGYFDYDKYKFHQDGTITDNNDKQVLDLNNIKIEDVSFSSFWSGMKSSESNPFEFKVLNGAPQVNLFFGLFETGHSLKINTYTDNDIFNLLVLNFLKTKKYI